MKKLLLSAIALFGAAYMAYADGSFDFTTPTSLVPEYPETLTEENFASYEDAVKDGNNYYFKIDGVTFSNGNVDVTPVLSDGTAPRLYYHSTNGIAMRIYKVATLTIAATDGANITSIVFTGTKVSSSAISGCDSGTLDDAADRTWTGNAATVVFDITGSTVINTITVTTQEVDPEAAPAAPTFSVKEGTYYEAQSVAINAAEGCDVYFTIDGTEPTTGSTLYDAPVEIATTTTLSAIAVKDGKTSEVATATYTIAERQFVTVNSVAELMQQEAGTEVLVNFDMTVGWCSNKNVFATDGDAFMQVYPSSAPGYEQGTVLLAGWTATFTYYKTTPELVPIEMPETTTGTFTAPIVAAADITDALVNYVLTVQNVTFAEDTPSSKATFTGTVGDVPLTFYNSYTYESQVAGTYNVTAVVNLYNGAVQLYPIAFEVPTTSGISEVEGLNLDAPCEYYNLQGIRVAAEGARGLLIVRQGNKAVKIFK